MLGTLVGLILDIVLVSLTLLDSVSDVLVALEFKDDPLLSPSYFYVAVTIVALGAVAESITFTLQLNNRHHFQTTSLSFFFYCVLFVPFAPLLGTVGFLLDRFEISFSSSTAFAAASRDETDSFSLFEVDGDAATAARVFDDESVRNLETLLALDQAVVSRKAALAVANVNAIVEALPMSILQLIAVSARISGGGGQELSMTLVVSLLLSLLSVSLKLFQFARAATLTAFFAFLIFMLFDVSRLAFISVTFVPPAALGTMMIYNKVIFVVLLALFMLAYSAWSLSISYTGVLNARFIGAMSLLVFVLVPCAAVPCAVLMELSFSWLVVLSVFSSSGKNQLRGMPVMHAFLLSGTGRAVRESTDWEATFARVEALLTEDPRLNSVAKFVPGIPRPVDFPVAPLGNFHGDHSLLVESRSAASGLPKRLALFEALRVPLPLSTSIMRRDDFWSRSRHLALMRKFFFMSSLFWGPARAVDESPAARMYEHKKVMLHQHAKQTGPIASYLAPPDAEWTLWVFFKRIFERDPKRLQATQEEELTALKREVEEERQREQEANIQRRMNQQQQQQQQQHGLAATSQPLPPPGPTATRAGWSLPLRSRIAQLHTIPAGSATPSDTGLLRVLRLSIAGTFVVLAMNSVCLSLAYPLVHCYYNYQHYEPLQKALLWPTLATFALGLLLLPTAVRYVVVLQFKCRVAATHGDAFALPLLAQCCFNSYFSVPKLILTRMIASEVAPAEALEHHVLPFLTSEQLQLMGMRPDTGAWQEMEAEFEKMKKYD